MMHLGMEVMGSWDYMPEYAMEASNGYNIKKISKHK